MTRLENMRQFLLKHGDNPEREPINTVLFHLGSAERELAEARESKDRISKRAEAIRCELVEMKKKFHQSESWRIEIFKQEQSSTNCAMHLREKLHIARTALTEILNTFNLPQAESIAEHALKQIEP